MTTPAPSAVRFPFQCTSAVLCSVLLAASPSLLAANTQQPADGPKDVAVTASGCLVTEADFMRANGMRPSALGIDLSGQVVIIDESGTAFSVNGTRERDLLTRLGSRVQLSGTLEGWSSDVSLERLPEDVPLGGPAHEASDAAVARVEGPVLTPPSLRRINVRSFQAIDGACAPLVRNTDNAARGAAEGERPVARLAAASTPTIERVRAQGCVLRDPSGSERLVLSQAVVRRPDVLSSSAVPGSLPSGTGSGTTPAPRPVASVGGTQAFYLVGQDKLTTALLGSRAEIVGTLAAADTVPAQRGTGHTSAAVRSLTVETVRSIGGACAP